MAGRAAATRGVELCGHARCFAAADRARGRAWWHVVGLGWLGAGSMRTQRAAHEHVRIWARLWRGVERGHSNRKTHGTRRLACARCIELSLYVKTVLKSQKVHEIEAKKTAAKNFARCARRGRRPAKNFNFP